MQTKTRVSLTYLNKSQKIIHLDKTMNIKNDIINVIIFFPHISSPNSINKKALNFFKTSIQLQILIRIKLLSSYIIKLLSCNLCAFQQLLIY